MNEKQRSPIVAYCEAHTTPQSQLLYELERETYMKTLAPQMMSGHLQGQLLKLFSTMIKPKSVLEIGTFTGYGALCLASGMPPESTLHTIEINDEMESLIRRYIDKAGFTNRIQLHIGNARTIVPTMDKTFDLVFIDCGKNDYAYYYDLVFDQVNQGGYIMADNVLWSGKVAMEHRDATTEKIDAFNKKILNDDRVVNVLLPVRDGLIIAQKL